MIEAEPLLAALKRAQAGLTLQQLISLLPQAAGNKPKLRPALRALVQAGEIHFDGARYRSGAAPVAAGPAQPVSQAVATRKGKPEKRARADEAQGARPEQRETQGARPEQPAKPRKGAAKKTEPSSRASTLPREHKPKPAAARPRAAPAEAKASPGAPPDSPRAEASSAAAPAEPAQPDSSAARTSSAPEFSRAAAQLPHGHGTSGPRTDAAQIPAALAEGIRLRRESQGDPGEPAQQRGAAHWGEAREKRAPKPRAKSGELVGLIQVKAEGYGFVAPLLGGPREEDVFVPPGDTGGAVDGDVVRLRLSRGRDGRTIGEVIEIVEARRQLVLGAYRARGKQAWVEPHDRRLSEPVFVIPSAEYNDGDLVKVQLTRGDDSVNPAQGGSRGRQGGKGERHRRGDRGGRAERGMRQPLRGELLGPLGQRGEAKFEILAAAFAQGFSDEFDATVRAEAARLPAAVRAGDREGRRDLRELPLCTIDGEDARDFDDAVYVEKSGSGYRLVVAIADVASYVHEGGAIDREALRRATSVYFPGTVLPMLPEQLSNGICSLNPDVERLCMVCDLQLDASGAPGRAELYPAVMRSHARLTYTQVFAVLQGETPAEPRIASRQRELLLAGELAKKMTARRLARGALDFDLPESKIVLDDQGEVAEIASRPRNDAHRLVEEFMLAANEAVARFFSERKLPTLYRVHDQPDADKLEAFGALAAAHGFSLPARLTPRALGELLEQLEDHPAQRALTQLLLRAMMQAHYTPDDIGHYGLAAPTYLHFTSPIRRYPDTTVHRLLWKFWAREGKPLTQQERDEQDAELAGVGAQCSERERAAMRAERDVVSFYSAAFMQKHLGEEFEASITGVADLGLFCQLDAPAVEGLVPAESLGDSVYFNQEAQTLESGSGQRWALGDRLRVRVNAADPAKRRITLGLADGSERQRGELDDAGKDSNVHKNVNNIEITNVHAPENISGPNDLDTRFLNSRAKKALDKSLHRGKPAREEPRRHESRGFGKELARAQGKPGQGFDKHGRAGQGAHKLEKPAQRFEKPGHKTAGFNQPPPGSRGPGPSRFGKSDKRGGGRFEKQGPFAKQGGDRLGGQQRHEPAQPLFARHAPEAREPAAPAQVKRPEPQGWLRPEDLAPGSLPQPRSLSAAPPRPPREGGGGPPPRHGRRPFRRR